MPWVSASLIAVREDFVLAALASGASFTEVCQRYNVARSTGYKWLRRYRQGGRGALRDQSRRPIHSPGRIHPKWLKALRQLRRRHPCWGPRKLKVRLRALHPRTHLPSARTLGRWLRRWGLAGRGRRHQRRGPLLKASSRSKAGRCNDVWTVDFKGWFRIGDGTRIDPLTIRDLKSRFLLDIRLLPVQTYEATRKVLQRVFRRHGLPRVIRVDNGPPFGGGGPRGLSRLAVWWLRLGINVEFGRPGHPEDNAAHEQMHRLYQSEVVTDCPNSRVKAQRHSDRWRKQYNQLRPHEALGMQTPASKYRGSDRPLPDKLREWIYPHHWQKQQANKNGRLYWKGRLRFIGEAFSKEWLGLRPETKTSWKVFLGKALLGVLHTRDKSSSIRPVMLNPR